MDGQDLYFFHLERSNDGIYSIVPWGSPDDIANGAAADCDVGDVGSACTYQRLYGTMP